MQTISSLKFIRTNRGTGDLWMGSVEINVNEEDTEATLFDLVQRKAYAEIDTLLQEAKRSQKTILDILRLINSNNCERKYQTRIRSLPLTKQW